MPQRRREVGKHGLHGRCWDVIKHDAFGARKFRKLLGQIVKGEAESEQHTHWPGGSVGCPKNLEYAPCKANFSSFPVEERITRPLRARITYTKVSRDNKGLKWLRFLNNGFPVSAVVVVVSVI